MNSPQFLGSIHLDIYWPPIPLLLDFTNSRSQVFPLILLFVFLFGQLDAQGLFQLCTQGSLLECLADDIGCWGTYERPYVLYYLSTHQVLPMLKLVLLQLAKEKSSEIGSIFNHSSVASPVL